MGKKPIQTLGETTECFRGHQKKGQSHPRDPLVWQGTYMKARVPMLGSWGAGACGGLGMQREQGEGGLWSKGFYGGAGSDCDPCGMARMG